ncbi:EscU/YscU/HrcU family type III secretion system export apparatus switch protein [Burkholderia pseudomallei]|uniref:EscU/YscU/HrcU family type III secretion system export apparatus switch protein n=1 Tax=Burkholderia pseudomallei TaxID=28450 RepID=UPI000978C7D3|nr:EscU/YscU/HrcU family type III secretion system export apparatus switch protein [Burkholderia pseudomallei]
MSEKTEKPTAKKLRDAARKGQTFKSKDVVAVIVLAVGAFAASRMIDLQRVMNDLALVAENGALVDPGAYVQQWGRLFLKLAVPFILVCAVAGMLPSLVQSRFTLAVEAIKFDLAALNPVNGFKKLFSWRSLKELLKALLYMVVFAVAVWLFVKLNHKELFELFRAPPALLGRLWVTLTVHLVFLFVVCALPLLALDVGMEFFLYYKDLKMDKHEVKQEYKESEGNPEVKSKRREVHFELLSEEVKANIEQSSLVLANPTHIAIGIYVNADITPRPFISVRETNARALAVIRYAELKGVPVVRNIPLARSVYKKCRRFQFVDRENLDAVLRVLLWLRQVEAANHAIETLEAESRAVPETDASNSTGSANDEAQRHNAAHKPEREVKGLDNGRREE